MSSAGDRLIMTKIRAEKALDADLKKQFEQVLDLLDPYDLDVSYGPFEKAFLEVVEQGAGKFLTLEQAFLRAYCVTEFGMDVVAKSTIQELIGWDARDRIAGSLSTVTKASIKAHTAKAHSVEKAYKDARTRAIATGKRHARTASREQSLKTVRDTKGLKGYKRVLTGSENCDFCRMLAGRGAVYDAESVTFLSHDDCSCLGVPQAGGPEPTMDQKYFASPRKEKKSDGDGERLKVALSEMS